MTSLSIGIYVQYEKIIGKVKPRVESNSSFSLKKNNLSFAFFTVQIKISVALIIYSDRCANEIFKHLLIRL